MGIMTALFGRGLEPVIQEDQPEHSKVEASEPTAAAAIEQTPVETEEDAEEISPYGEQALGLTRFGDTWINLSLVQGVDLNPADGCGAEVITTEHVYHLCDADANALEKFLMETASQKQSL